MLTIVAIFSIVLTIMTSHVSDNKVFDVNKVFYFVTVVYFTVVSNCSLSSCVCKIQCSSCRALQQQANENDIKKTKKKKILIIGVEK